MISLLLLCNFDKCFIEYVGPPSLQADATQFSGPTTGQAEITVSVAGSSPLNVRLFKVVDGGESIEITSPRFNYTFNNGVFQLTVSDVHVEDGGTYRIEATNPLGTTPFDVVLVTVGKLRF